MRHVTHTHTEVEEFIAAQGFATVRRRRWRMSAREAADFLQTSWGSAAGDRDRRFFSEMVNSQIDISHAETI